jgi:hypothetical protein
MKVRKPKIGIFILSILLSTVFFVPKVSATGEFVEIESQIIEQLNQERRSAGLEELEVNELLNKAAFLKAQDMIGHDYFAHTSPEDVNPWYWLEEVEYQYKYAGENLAMDFSSASSVHKAWMKSQTHRENIMSERYKEVGVAVLEGIIDGKETRVGVQFFGAPLNENSIGEKIPQDEEPNNKEITLLEVSVRPWEGEIEDEMIVYAKLSGEPSEVEVHVGKNYFPLQELQDHKYMNLISLEGLDLNKDTIVVKAQATEQEALYFQVPKGIYAEYIPQQETEGESDEVLSAVATINSTNLNVKERAINSQNIVLAGFMLVCMIMIANVWILEKEEEKLIEMCRV